MELSRRLAAVAGMVSQGHVVCDAGCDHGYVSIYLVQAGISPRVIAMDVRTGPLAHAREHIRMYGLEDYIETRLSDGVEALDYGEADTLILAGMGGRLMEGILTRGMDKIRGMKELILQPQSELVAFRRFLQNRGFLVVKEDMVYEDGKFYPMMRVIPDANPGKAFGADEQDMLLGDLYGELLLKERHPVLKQYLDFQKEKLEALLRQLEETGRNSERGKRRMAEVAQELSLNEKARDWYGIERKAEGR